MSANNIVVIVKEGDGKFRGYHRDVDAYYDGYYDIPKGKCPFCEGTGKYSGCMPDNICHDCNGTGHFVPSKEQFVFEADTVEEAICEYHKWLKRMNEDGFFPFYVEYGYTFEGVDVSEETRKALKKIRNRRFNNE